jgi:chorismate-pyruvate lyase
MTDAEALAAWLLARQPGRPVEECGATAIFTAICGQIITADIQSRRVRPPTAREQRLLQAPGAPAVHERRGTLQAASGMPVAEITAVVLPSRLPGSIADLLGITGSGAALTAAAEVPLGRALRGLGVRREPLQARRTPGASDAAGQEQVIYSASRLWLGGPVAVVTERVYRSFLAAFPRPWPASPR